jgi:hypothetical protein
MRRGSPFLMNNKLDRTARAFALVGLKENQRINPMQSKLPRQRVSYHPAEVHACFSIGTKWLETLKQVATRVTRVALVFNPQTAPFADLFWRPIEAAAPSFAVVPTSFTGSPDESGTKRREKGLARSGNARVRRGMIQLAWRFLMFQRNSALAQWFRARTENARGTLTKRGHASSFRACVGIPSISAQGNNCLQKGLQG